MASVINAFVNSFSHRLDEPTRKHLKNVYGCVALSTVSAAIGAYVHPYTGLLQASLLTSLIGIGLLLALVCTPDNGKNQLLRLSYLQGIAFNLGLGLYPLCRVVIEFDPSIIVTALVGTTVIFVSFSICALLAERGYWLFLGGLLLSALNTLVVFAIVSVFFGRTYFSHVQYYGGFFVMCGFVLYDTQSIIEKFHMGSKDFILHSLDLFMDFIGIFRYLLVILKQKELSARQRKDKDARRD